MVSWSRVCACLRECVSGSEADRFKLEVDQEEILIAIHEPTTKHMVSACTELVR